MTRARPNSILFTNGKRKNKMSFNENDPVDETEPDEESSSAEEQQKPDENISARENINEESEVEKEGEGSLEDASPDDLMDILKEFFKFF